MTTVFTNFTQYSAYPVKVLQFGEGNFLRAFVDDMIEQLNESTDFNGSVVILKPRPTGDLSGFRKQNCNYTIMFRGVHHGQMIDYSKIITSVKEVLNTTHDFQLYMDYAKCPTLEFIISNTTEAGIACDDTDLLDMTPASSFPGKITQFLYSRYNHFDGDTTKGIVFLPVELIDNNGSVLNECIIRTAKKWGLPQDFIHWINTSCSFCNTLVDRIVTGFPAEDYDVLASRLGYDDKLLVVAEPYAFWAIESPDSTLADRFPVKRALLPVTFTRSCKYYKERKVRILNGVHTSFCLIAYLCNQTYVREALQDSSIRTFVEKLLFSEIIPSMSGEMADVFSFANATIERFENPFINHKLLDISLNSVSKWRARCLPSMLDYVNNHKDLPIHLVFSLAALLAFYRGHTFESRETRKDYKGVIYHIADVPEVLDFFQNHRDDCISDLVNSYLSSKDFHGINLCTIKGLPMAVFAMLSSIYCNGMKHTMEHLEVSSFLRIHPEDNVEVALTNNKKAIPLGHKIACSDIGRGGKVIKYGSVIGRATCNIPSGSHVHLHNLETCISEYSDLEYSPVVPPKIDVPLNLPKTFWGYPRKVGNPGIRNYIYIIPTVGCVNKIARNICNLAQERFGHIDNIDGIICLEHSYGCSQLGSDQQNTQKIIAGLCTQPNAGGVLLLGLGCENSNIGEIKKHLNPYDEDMISFLIAQEHNNEIEAGLACLEKLIINGAACQRKELPVSQLSVGLKCGGSDGLSGITANPLVGCFSDYWLKSGGSALLTEIPEMFGAERVLLSRCKDIETFDKLKGLINRFKEYYIQHGERVYENPSPGNKAGGISTLEDKSLGCVQKAGTSIISDVLNYGEKISASGLSILSAPGNDLVATTALAAAGVQLILFTTGRGTPLSAPIPTLKISSNSTLAEKKANWIDFDAGRLLSDENLNTLANGLYEEVLAVASGKSLKSENSNLYDMAILKTGVTL